VMKAAPIWQVAPPEVDLRNTVKDWESSMDSDEDISARVDLYFDLGT